MARLCDLLAWLLNSLGLALLLLSLILVPQGQMLADPGQGGDEGELKCAGHATCKCTGTEQPPCECRTDGPNMCGLIGNGCKTSIQGCEGCTCLWDAGQSQCICKLTGT